MRGIIWDGAQLHLADDLEVRDPGPGEVRIRVLASGICHSDLYAMKIAMPNLPVVLGHEAAGVIDMLGEGVTSRRIGEPVTVNCQTPCGHCPDCERGNLSACPEAWMAVRQPFTWRGKPVFSSSNTSSFAQKIVVKADQAYNAEGIPAPQAALIGCAVSTGVGAVRNLGRVGPGDIVAVIGIGGIGVNALQAARLAGAARIIAVDVDPRKLETARRFGATDTVVVARGDSTGDITARIQSVLPRIDVVVECTGVPSSMEAAMRLPWVGGRAVMIGLPPPDAVVSFPAMNIIAGKTYLSDFNGGTKTGAPFQALIDDVRAGRLEVASQVSGIWKMDDYQAAMSALRKGEVTRAVLDLS